jgi:hypothetical protein
MAPAAAAAVGLMMVVWLRGPGQPPVEATDLLSRSAAVELPEARVISLSVGGRTFLRPAVLRDAVREHADLAHWARRFEEAEYSWREPLSARSYQKWRDALRRKRDAVSVIQRRGQTEAYRVRTDSPEGLLRSASLTVRAHDLRPTHGAFQFAGEALVEIGEASLPPSVPPPPQVQPPVATEPPTESPAGPEDTLHVLAALNGIGADVGEPVEVSEDPAQRRVVVRARGITVERQQEIADALKGLPRVVTDFASGSPTPPATDSSAAELSASDLPASVRRRLEDRLGGAIALQEVTDRVLEESGTLVARAHALETLAAKFSPETENRLSAAGRELLHTLRARHVAELKRLHQRILTDLEPILSAARAVPVIAAKPSWQSMAADLVVTARHTDRLLHRLLAGSYSQAPGEEMWGALRPQLSQLEEAIRLQEDAGR